VNYSFKNVILFTKTSRIRKKEHASDCCRPKPGAFPLLRGSVSFLINSSSVRGAGKDEVFH